METRTTFCSHCDKSVKLAITPAPGHGGQASLPEGGDLVCLDFGKGCDGGQCPISGLPSIVMGFRLARSGEVGTEPWPLVHTKCHACEEVADLEVLDSSHAYCTMCGSTSTLLMLPLDDGHYVALSRGPGTFTERLQDPPS